MFCDNLTGQSNPAIRESVSKLNGVVWYGLKNGTDIWQPVDAGYAEKLKVMIKHSFFDWLDDDENADKWYSVESFTASNVVSCSLTGLEMHIEGYLTTNGTPIVIAYLKTGCLVPADSSNNNLIQPEGLKDYKVPPPVVIQPAVNIPATIEIEQSEDDEDDNNYDLDIEAEEEREILIFDDQENIPKDVELEERNLFDFIKYNI